MSDDDAPKSAYEIAMEKLRARGGFEETKLTDEQKAEIAEVRSRYRARIAQLEIESASKLAQATSLEELETQKAEIAKEKQRLKGEMEEKVETIRER
jgi:hypothetical protein